MMGNKNIDRPISLLVGFDAMRSFLRAQWAEDEKQSDDLADLLSNISRDVWANSQPLDIAQWSDWLDAILSVRPDLHDVQEARRQMQEDHHEFLKALKIVPLEKQRKALDELRSKASLQSWHRIGFFPLSALDAYEAMRSFVQAYWKRSGKGSAKLSALLDQLTDANAQWNDWMNSIEQARAEVARSPLVS